MIKLNLNGRDAALDVDADTPLRLGLRDTLRLSGPKLGCVTARPGACSVHPDGQPVRSGVTALVAPGARQLTTREGPSSELNLAQGGHRPPSDPDSGAHLSGNPCRCGTSSRTRAAIQRAATLRAGA